MGLDLRDHTIRDLAERLAEAQRTTVTEAVRRALERALAKEADRAERERSLDHALARLDAMPRQPYNDDMYDEFGNPK